MLYSKVMKQRSNKLYFPDFEPQKSSRRWYQHDIDVIIYSEMFRKMQRKAQLLSIYDPVSRSRLIHTFEVVRIAKEISDKLGLNSELTEAIALAHDFGNVAYGKKADQFLQEKTKGLFKHEEVSSLMLKVSCSRSIPDKYRKQALEAIDRDSSKTHIIKISEFPYFLEVYQYKKSIYYICISPEIIDGIIKHGTSEISFTLEGQVVNYADNIAYLIQDISDLEATGIFDKETRERYERSLAHLESQDSNKKNPVSEIVGKTTGTRTAALIERFVSYNKKRLAEGNYKTIDSPILGTKIPILEIEPVTREAIDCCWNFKEEFYGCELIKISNITSQSKMEQLWNILQKDSLFIEKNEAYIEFNNLLSSPIFESFRQERRIEKDCEWNEWKKAYFIAHLTCDEIDLIITSFLERDYVFSLSLPAIGKN